METERQEGECQEENKLGPLVVDNVEVTALRRFLKVWIYKGEKRQEEMVWENRLRTEKGKEVGSVSGERAARPRQTEEK